MAKDYLKAHGVKTGYYDELVDDEWHASSNYLEFDGGVVLGNSIAFYLSGDKLAAKSLKLKLNVNAPEKEEIAIEHFVDIAETLLSKALDGDASTNLKALNEDGQNAETTVNGKIASLTRHDWQNDPTGAYDIELEIRVPNGRI